MHNSDTIKGHSNNIDMFPSINVFHIGWYCICQIMKTITYLDNIYSYTLSKDGYVENLKFYAKG